MKNRCFIRGTLPFLAKPRLLLCGRKVRPSRKTKTAHEAIQRYRGTGKWSRIIVWASYLFLLEAEEKLTYGCGTA